MLTYALLKTQSMLLSATIMKGQPDADLHPAENPGHALVSNKQEQLAGASHMLTYQLFKIQSMLLSATSRKGQPDADLHPVENPEHALVSNKQEQLARCWLTICSKSKAWSFQQKAEGTSHMLTYKLFKT